MVQVTTSLGNVDGFMKCGKHLMSVFFVLENNVDLKSSHVPSEATKQQQRSSGKEFDPLSLAKDDSGQSLQSKQPISSDRG